jgi:hypothetical protein
MFRSYDHLQAEKILLASITQLTTDPLFYTIAYTAQQIMGFKLVKKGNSA